MYVSGIYNNIKGNQTHTTFKYKAPNYLSTHVFSIECRHGKGRCEKWYCRLYSCFKLPIRKAVFVGHSMGGYVALAFAELYSENVRTLVLMNSTSKADSEERKHNRDLSIKAVKRDYSSFIRLSIGNLFSPDNRQRLIDEIEKVKIEALKTPLQGVVASLEGMKIRKDREVLLHLTPYPKMLILGEKDPVLMYETALEQIEETTVKLVTFPMDI